MQGHYENISKVNLLLTEPSQVSEVGPVDGVQQTTLHTWRNLGDCSRVSAPGFTMQEQAEIAQQDHSPRNESPSNLVRRWLAFS